MKAQAKTLKYEVALETVVGFMAQVRPSYITHCFVYYLCIDNDGFQTNVKIKLLFLASWVLVSNNNHSKGLWKTDSFYHPMKWSFLLSVQRSFMWEKVFFCTTVSLVSFLTKQVQGKRKGSTFVLFVKNSFQRQRIRVLAILFN